MSTTVSETYASKSDLTTLEGSVNTQFKQTADTISTHASSIEKLQSDTTQAQLDITEATKKATQAQTQASTALSNAQSAQTLADEAKKKADSAQTNLDSANKELADAKANLETVTGRVDATESEITKAQTRLTNAESAVKKAQTDASTAQSNAQTAIDNAKAAQTTADTAKANAEQAQKDLNALTNRVTKTETAIKQNSEKITIQAESVTEIKGIASSANSNASSALNKANNLTDRANSGEFDGRGVASTTVEYQASTSGTTVPTGTWSPTIPTVAQGSYLWTKTTTNYTSGTPTVGYSVARMGVNGAKGDKGETGQTGPQGPQGLKGDTGLQGPKGATGPQGATGAQGPKGADGKSPTVSVSKSGNVTTITVNNPDGTKTSQTVKDGTNGTPGKDGATGKTTYFHVKYSNDGGKTFTSNSGETVGDYIGTYTDFVEADSTSVSSYTWAKIKGAQGDKGATGAKGDTGPQGPQGLKGDKGATGAQGPTGPTGATGTGVASMTQQYYMSDSKTTQSGGSWVESMPTWSNGKYLWTRYKVVYKNPTSTVYTTPVCDSSWEAVNEESIKRQSAIETKANEITSKVSETYVSNSAFEHYQKDVTSQFIQTKDDFTWTIGQNIKSAKTEIGGQINGINGTLKGLTDTTDEIKSYMSFDKDALTLGKSGNKFKTQITNQEWAILKDSEKVTYINDKTMYITDGQFTESLKVGNFGFVPRANGSLDFKKIR